MQNSNTPIVIGGCHRSGTTLVRRLMNSHPRIFCPSEIKFHMDLLRQFPNDPLEFARLGRTIDALGLADDVWLDEFGKAFVRCYDSATQRVGKARWADKNPENAVNVGYWNRLFDGQFSFIMVIRHPFDVLASMEETPMPRVLPKSSVGRAQHICRYVETGLAFCNSHPSISKVIKYEDLVLDPANTLRSLLAFLGEDFSPDLLSAFSLANSSMGLEDPKICLHRQINTDGVGRWRSSLSDETLQAVSSLLSPLIRNLYPQEFE